MTRMMSVRVVRGLTGMMVVAFGMIGSARAEIVEPVSISSAFTAFSGSFPASNAINGNNADYASLHGGVNTFVQFDFGSVQAVDRAILINRDSGAADDLFKNITLTYDAGSQSIVTAGIRGRSDVYALTPGLYTQGLRFDVDTQVATGGNNNVGLMEAIFLRTPHHSSIVSGVSAYNAATAFNGNYVAANAVNNVVGFSGSVPAGIEYASAGQGTNMFVDFDLGATKPISGFDFIDRLSSSDQLSSYDLIFSNVSNFATTVATLSYTKSGAADSDTFSTPINARYVRLDATGGANNTGVNEMIFYERRELPTPTILTHPSEFSSRYVVDHLFDNQLTGVNADWAANGEGPTSFTLDLGGVAQIDGINWANRNDSGGFLNDLPDSITIQFSMDNIFDGSDPTTTITSFAADQLLHAYMFSQQVAQYLKITVTGQNPPAGNVGGAQMNFFGVMIPTPEALPAGLTLLAMLAGARQRRAS
ncbi:MAG: hypothetical protein GC162_15035 [Planctomycetes bacterium]|nr:hypothetical protein [Planctomycetota bacterium]